MLLKTITRISDRAWNLVTSKFFEGLLLISYYMAVTTAVDSDQYAWLAHLAGSYDGFVNNYHLLCCSVAENLPDLFSNQSAGFKHSWKCLGGVLPFSEWKRFYFWWCPDFMGSCLHRGAVTQDCRNSLLFLRPELVWNQFWSTNTFSAHTRQRGISNADVNGEHLLGLISALIILVPAYQGRRRNQRYLTPQWDESRDKRHHVGKSQK